ncbi:hypothetical protein B0H16DRAFT_1841182 [Mycena metata]|uniref:Uncharacterized protein n=1 Tax=Mycena metata TaxID=1033252 RepID=A0AAD7DQD6_9AGAR|nr:hypothetical protein B0H16DRAFT_1841182 [Mycena metata]
MPPQQTATRVRLDNISTCVTITINTLNILVHTLKIYGLEAMVNTTQSLLKLVQTIKQDKNECAELMEQTYVILNAIIGIYIKSDTGLELPPSTLNKIANFTQTLHKIHTFVEAQQSGSKVKKFFRQGEISGLLKDCKAGLQQGLAFFQMSTVHTKVNLPTQNNMMSTALEMEEQAQMTQQELLNMIETVSNSDSASFVCRWGRPILAHMQGDPKLHWWVKSGSGHKVVIRPLGGNYSIAEICAAMVLLRNVKANPRRDARVDSTSWLGVKWCEFVGGKWL